MAPRILVIGMSHIWAIQAAAEAEGATDVSLEFIGNEMNLRRLQPEALAAFAERVGPTDLLCFALFGNFHNALAMMNHPDPFWIVGAPEAGQFIPQDMLVSYMQNHRQFVQALGTSRALAEVVPHRKRIVIDPPPPSGDAAHIAEFPGGFAEKLKLGVSPDALRVQAYRLQSEVYRRHARELEAEFLPSNPATHAPNGMLAREFWKEDPTHANTAYGAFVLADLRRIAGDLT